MVTPRALVLGDQGFIGRHLTRALDHQGWYVAGMDLQRGPDQDIRRRLPSFRGTWDLVAHCAAVIGGRQGIEGCPLCLAENLELDAVVLKWCAQRRPGRLLYFSSSAVYPVHLQELPLPAGHWAAWGSGRPLVERDANPGDYSGTPDRVYGWGKLVGEALCQELHAGGVPVTVVRPFSGYGADQDPAYPFAAFLARASARADPFEVWGTGQQVRDWVHVDDIIRACLVAIQQGVTGPLNICTGVGTSFDELAALFCGLAGYHPALRHDYQAPAGVAWRVGDPTQLQQVCAPQVALVDGIRRALAAPATS